MANNLTDFLHDSETKAFDLEHRRKLRFNISKYDKTVEKGRQQYRDMESARKIGKNLKWKAIANLDKYLIEFERNFTANGGKVIWAEDANEALKSVKQIATRHQVKSVVKSKSMTTEELHLNDMLESNDIEVFETDLGEYIVQLANEKPYHIVTPAMHKSKDDVAELFNKKLNTDINLTAEELTLVARENLREKYTTADMGITGGNFILPDIGGIAVTENEGNARLTTTFPKVHVAIVGIEKMIPSVKDLSLFWPLLATMGTGQNVTVFNTIFTGPKRQSEADGPEAMYVILLDNNRTALLAETLQREALYCIRCGACLNACPVYKNIGGHAYNTTYSGPIGSVITPHLRGMEDFKHLSQASSLCGNCTEVCPVKIEIHNLLLYNRRDAVEQGISSFSEKAAWKMWKRMMKKRKRMNRGSVGLKNVALKFFFKKSWAKRRDMIQLAPKSFNELWAEMDKQ
jgi:L-lactate dehydrogenase complex protein LldF